MYTSVKLKKLISDVGQFLILPALRMMMDFGVFDAVPFEGSISTGDLAAAVKLDATIMSVTDRT